MPSERSIEYLEHILQAIHEIEIFISGINFSVYEQDRKTQAAVERMLLIVSEAAKRLGADAEDLCPEVEWKPICTFGNIVRHEYDRMVNQRVWEIVHEDLPILQEAVRKAYRSYTGQEFFPISPRVF